MFHQLVIHILEWTDVVFEILSPSLVSFDGVLKLRLLFPKTEQRLLVIENALLVRLYLLLELLLQSFEALKVTRQGAGVLVELGRGGLAAERSLTVEGRKTERRMEWMS